MPEIHTITPNYTEISWPEMMIGDLLSTRIQVERSLHKKFYKEILELRAGYHNIAIRWKKQVPEKALKEFLTNIQKKSSNLQFRIWEVPVCYEFDLGKDLISLSDSLGISPNELVRIHTKATYQLNFYGFLPGFMYLSGLDSNLFHPRKSIPDREIPEGSVAIGGNQTGIYPQKSPGGWYVIGRSPLPFFDSKFNPPVWAEPGDHVKFKSIDRKEFDLLSKNPQFPQAL